MSLFRQLVTRVAQELRDNPEARAKAQETFEKDVKPRAKKAFEDAKPMAKQTWEETKPEIANMKTNLFKFAKKVRDEYKKGLEGEDSPPPSPE